MTRIGTEQESAAPLGAVDVGQLVFTRGAAHLTIGVDGSMEDLYRARFEGKVPDIRVDGGTVTVKYRIGLRPPRGEIVLSGRVPWAIRARMGMSHVVADLEGLELRGLEISAGASQVEVRLPRPKDATRVRIGGRASDVGLIRPAGAPVRVHMGVGCRSWPSTSSGSGPPAARPTGGAPPTIRLQVGTTSRSAPEPVRSLSEPRAGCGWIGGVADVAAAIP